MHVFVAGATGVLGSRLVATCVDRGHEVVGLSRDEQGDAIVRKAGGEPIRGDVLNQESLIDPARGADVVVHAATKIPTETSIDDEAWATNDRVRREGAGNLIAAAGAVDANRFIQQSVVWLARQPDGHSFDETAESHPDRSTKSALDAERIVTEGGETHGFASVILRGGYFYAHDAAHTRSFGRRLIDRDLPIIGGGLLGRRDATLSFLHVDDAASAYAAAIVGRDTGIYHVVDDEPVAYAVFLRELADRLEAPSPRRVPAWLTKWFVDEHIVRLLTSPMPTTNERFREAFDWDPAYPTVRDGLDHVVEQWRDTETVRSTDDGYAWVNA